MFPWVININPCVSTANQPLPTRDGELRFYLSLRRQPGTFKTDVTIPASQINQPIIYVNGIQTSPAAHKLTCLAMSWLFNRAVLGVFNKSGSSWWWSSTQSAEKWLSIRSGADFFKNSTDPSDGGPISFLQDISQCQSDFQMALIPEQWTALAKLCCAKAALLGLPKAIVVRSVFFAKLSGNPATRQLVGLLERAVDVMNWKTIYLVAHSQGCLISSVATAAFLAMRRALDLPLPDIYMRGLASPAPRWSNDPRLYVGTYKFSEDPVPHLIHATLVKSLSNDGLLVDDSLQMAAHDVRYYMSEFLREFEDILPMLDTIDVGR
jgi:hypothetical protein